MEIDNSEIEVHGPNGGEFWYSNSAISSQGRVAEVHIFANNIEDANAVGQGIAIAKSHHMNRGARYVATKRDYDECFRD